MAPRQSIWYHLGHAYERARKGAPSAGKAVAGLSERRVSKRPEKQAPRESSWPSGDDLISAGAMLVLERIIGGRRRGREAGFTSLLRAGAAGAAAALLVELVRPLLHAKAELPILDRETGKRLLSGIGQGLVYGALVEPRVPGPPLVKGALYGSVEYAVDPMGGLSTLLGPHVPQARLPIVGELLEGTPTHDRAYLEHLVFGIALALLYESSPSSNGIRPEVFGEDEE